MVPAERLLAAVAEVYRAGTYELDARWQAICRPSTPSIADYLRVHVKRLEYTFDTLPGLRLPESAHLVLDLGTWEPYHSLLRAALPGRVLTCAPHTLDLESEALPYDDGSVALVLLLEVIEHFYQDPMFALAEINRVLAPGGTLLISTPNLASFRAVVAVLGHYSPLLYGKFTPGNPPHVHEFVPRDLRLLLEIAGFSANVWTANAYHSETPQEIREWLLQNGFSPDEREDTIFAVATKVSPPRERYPLAFYDGVPPVRRLKRAFV